MSFENLPDELLVNVIHFYVSNCSDYKNLLLVSNRFNMILTEWPYVWKSIVRDVLLSPGYVGKKDNNTPPEYFRSTPVTRTLYKQFRNRRRGIQDVEVNDDGNGEEDVPPPPPIEEMPCLAPTKFCPVTIHGRFRYPGKFRHLEAAGHLSQFLNTHGHNEYLTYGVKRVRFFDVLLSLYNRDSLPNFNVEVREVNFAVKSALRFIHVLRASFFVLCNLGVLLSVAVFVAASVYVGHGFFGFYLVESIIQGISYIFRNYWDYKFNASTWKVCAIYVFNPEKWGSVNSPGLVGRHWPVHCGFFQDVMWPYLHKSPLFSCRNPNFVDTRSWYLHPIHFISKIVLLHIPRVISVLIVFPVQTLEKYWPEYIAPVLHVLLILAAVLYVFAFWVYILLTRLKPIGWIRWLRIYFKPCLRWEMVHLFVCYVALRLLDPSPIFPVWLGFVVLTANVFGTGLKDENAMIPRLRSWGRKKFTEFHATRSSSIFAKIWWLVFLVARFFHLGLICKFGYGLLFGKHPNLFQYAMQRSSKVWLHMANLLTIQIEKCPRTSTFLCFRLLWDYCSYCFNSESVLFIFSFLIEALYLMRLQRFYKIPWIYLTIFILFVCITFPIYGFSRGCTLLQ